MLNCLVVDDESMGRKLLESNIEQVPFLKLVGSCRNAFEALRVLQEETVDLVFLDIQMPGMLGTELLKSLPRKPLVILVTAYSEYALEGYELDIVDYLMKPASTERFMRAVNKAYERHRQQQSPTPVAAPDPANTLFLNVEYALVKVQVADILYVESLKDYVKVVLDGPARPIITKQPLKAMEEKLPRASFMRVHRSYLVNLTRIDRIKGLRLNIGQTELPISEHLYDELLTRLNYTK